MEDWRRIESERLVLRAWRPEDRASFAEMNRDPAVVEFLPAPLSRQDSDALMDRIIAHFERHGFGLWALEVPGEATCIGFTGLSVPGFEAPFTPCVEIGWRLTVSHWGQGYATEAARAALRFGFEARGLEEVVSFTVPANIRSIAVMERIGMVRDPAADFLHPRLAAGDPLQLHVLYRLSRQAWQKGRDAEV